MVTISPGSISLIYSAPMTWNAQVSLLTAYPSPSFPSTRGRSPYLSRQAYILLAVMIRKAKAPSTSLRAFSIEKILGLCASALSFFIRCASTSLSDDDWNRLPLSSNDLRRME